MNNNNNSTPTTIERLVDLMAAVQQKRMNFLSFVVEFDKDTQTSDDCIRVKTQVPSFKYLLSSTL